MKKTLLGLILLTRVCEPATVWADSNKTPKEKTYACSLQKYHGEISFKCGDKTVTRYEEIRQVQAPAAPATVTAPQTLHIKEFNGAEHTDLIHISITGVSAHTVFNKTNGHTLSYDPNGVLVSVTKTFYATTDCSGQAFAYPASGPSVKNRIIGNTSATPINSTALLVTDYSSASLPIKSQFMNGACTPMNANVSQLSLVTPVQLDAADPSSILLPLELIFN